jgi:hypothetical protein
VGGEDIFSLKKLNVKGRYCLMDLIVAILARCLRTRLAVGGGFSKNFMKFFSGFLFDGGFDCCAA